MAAETHTPPRAPAPATAAATVPGRREAAVLAGVRVTLGVLWLTNAGWKAPPDFGRDSGRGLFAFVSKAVEEPVFGPWTWFVREIVLPNFTVFGWSVLIMEACLGGFLLFGLGTRFWALVGAGQSTAIGLTLLKAPNEWPWAYYLMVAAHLAVFAVAAGRTAGLDGVLRPGWQARPTRLNRLLLRAS